MTDERRSENRLLVGSALLPLLLAMPLAMGGDAIVMAKKAYANGGGGGGSGGSASGGGAAGAAGGAAGAAGGAAGAAGGAAGAAGGAGGAAGGAAGAAGGAAGAAGGAAGAAGSAAGTAAGSAPGGATYSSDLSVIDAFLRSPRVTYPLDGQQSTVSVQSPFVDRLGQTCRIVEQRVIIAGEQVKASGTMCLQPDGRWALVP